MEELLHELNGAKVFSKLDMNHGYLQLELSPESRYITTFSTHKGLKRYTRLNFGTTSSAEIFQNAIQEIIQGIEGARNISDDIIIFGTDQHDRALAAVLQRFSERNLTLNRSKCLFNKTTLEFFGSVFSPEGTSPDPKKVSTLKEASPPTNASACRSFLYMGERKHPMLCQPHLDTSRKEVLPDRTRRPCHCLGGREISPVSIWWTNLRDNYRSQATSTHVQ